MFCDGNRAVGERNVSQNLLVPSEDVADRCHRQDGFEMDNHAGRESEAAGRRSRSLL
jgi:hypothetical protein